MPKHRIFEAQTLQIGQDIFLSATNTHHLINVLKVQVGKEIILFNDNGNEYTGVITSCDKKHLRVNITNATAKDVTSPLDVHLGQVISRGDKMEMTIQKSVELGVQTITPLLSKRCGVQLCAQRQQKKHQQWQKIIIHACQQSGRTRLPTLHPITHLENWIQQLPANTLKVTMAPHSIKRFRDLALIDNKIGLLIGSEGGLTPEEISSAEQAGFHQVQLGPRILRTETAALATLSVLQARWGDF